MSDLPPSIVAIDIGTHKVSVLVGRVHAPDRIEVVGMAHAPNRGMSKGVIKNMDKVVAAIKEAVAQAEDMADCRIHTAWVAIPSPDLMSFNATGRTPVMHETIGTTELVRTLEMAKSSHLMPDYYLINAVQMGVEIDEQREWVEHPIGMSAKHITGHYHLMMLPINTMQNLERAMKGAGVGIERMIVSSLATAESALLADERLCGVCLIDIGAGTTNVSVYMEGHLILSHTIPRGGEHVTRDIAAVLQTTMEQAEALKIRHGCVDRAGVKPDQMIQVAGIGAAAGLTVSRIELADIITARYEEIFETVRQELDKSGAINILQHGAVLAGDASQIEGAVTLARRVLGVKVHLGNTPVTVDTAEDRRPQLRRAVYTTACGLLLYTQSDQQRIADSGQTDVEGGQSLIERMVLAPWHQMVDKLRQLM
ncbi:MAG: cell division protein FtsA [Pseudomonadota bacterium]